MAYPVTLADAFRSMILERKPRPIDVHWEQPRTTYQPGLEQRNLFTTGPANMSRVSSYGQLLEDMANPPPCCVPGPPCLPPHRVRPCGYRAHQPCQRPPSSPKVAPLPNRDPTLSSVALGTYKYGFLVQVSAELVRDAGVNLEAYLAREAGQAIGLGLGNHLINGTGTGQPRGVILDATVGATGPTGTASSFGRTGHRRTGHRPAL